MDMIVTVVLGGGMILLGLLVGGGREWAHLADLSRRETGNLDFLVTDVQTFAEGADPACGAAAVFGDCVIGTDYFKTLATKMRNLFGGEMKSAERLFERARREALLRMVDDARSRGFDAVCNVRFGTSQVGSVRSAKMPPIAEMLVSGTAYRRAPAPRPPA